MSRPTPEQIINKQMLSRRIGQALVEELAEHGYVVVHHDDRRARDEAIINAAIAHADRSIMVPDYDAIIAAAEQETPNGYPTN